MLIAGAGLLNRNSILQELQPNWAMIDQKYDKKCPKVSMFHSNIYGQFVKHSITDGSAIFSCERIADKKREHRDRKNLS